MSFEPQSPSTDANQNTDDRQSAIAPHLGNWVQHFFTGFILTAIMSGVFLATSAYMTHVPLFQMGGGTLGVAIALPIISGILTMCYPQPVLRALEKMLQTMPL